MEGQGEGVRCYVACPVPKQLARHQQTRAFRAGEWGRLKSSRYRRRDVEPEPRIQNGNGRWGLGPADPSGGSRGAEPLPGLTTCFSFLYSESSSPSDRHSISGLVQSPIADKSYTVRLNDHIATTYPSADEIRPQHPGRPSQPEAITL
jgi:hypothetical protein